MRVRALRPFQAYRPENCFFITATAAGEEFTDPTTAAYLIETHCPDVEAADEEAIALALRYVPQRYVAADAQPVSNAVDGGVTVVVGEQGPELVVAGGVAVAPVVGVDPAPYNESVEGPVEDRLPAADVEPIGDDSAPPPAFDPAEHTVEEVLEYVEAHPEQRGAVLAMETATDGKHRVTIVKALGD